MTTKAPAIFDRDSLAYLDGMEYPVDAPRYPAGGGVMVEEGTTNLLLNPQMETVADWYASNAGLLEAVAAPGSPPPGVINCLRETVAEGQTNCYIYQTKTLALSTQYTWSVWAYVPSTVPAGKALVAIMDNNWATLAYVFVIERDQWVRKTLTFTSHASLADHRIAVGISGSGITAGMFSYAVRGQLEQKPYATSWQDTNVRARESLTVPNSGLSPAGGTLEVKVEINAMARRQVAEQYVEVFCIVRANGGEGIKLRHSPDTADWKIVSYADDGTYTISGPIPDSVIPDGIRVLRCDWDGTSKVVRLYCDTNLTPIATITDAKLPSAFGKVAIGGRSDTAMLNSTFHAVRLSNAPRGAEGLHDADTPFIVDANTLGLWQFNNTLAATWAIPPTRKVHARFRIGRSDGATWVDLADYLVHAVVELGNVDAVGTENAGVDGVARMLTFTLKQQGGASFSPRVQDSTWNQFSGIYDPLLAPNREVYLAVAFTAPGGTPAEEDYIEIFRGLLGSRITLDGPTMGRIRCTAFDRTRILQRCFIEQVRQYGSETGTCAENDIVQIMEDNLGVRAPLLVVDNEGATNELLNPSFEADANADGLADAWTHIGSGVPSLVESPVWDGFRAQQLDVAIEHTGSIYQSAAAAAGAGYMFRAAIQAAAVETDAAIRMTLTFKDAGGEVLDSQSIAIRQAHTGLVQRAVFGAAPAGAATVEAAVEAAGGGRVVIDAAELRTCALSGKMNKPYSVELQSVRDAIHIHAKQAGWFLGYRRHIPAGTYTSAGWHLKFMEPPRDKDASTADFDLSHLTDLHRQDLDISDDGVRNAIYVTYRDSASGERRTVLREDAASIAAHGRLACWFEEGDASLIDTDAEAQAMADAALADLKDFLGTTRLDMPLLPELDTFAGVTVSHPGVSSTTDFYGIISVRHELNWERGRFRTEAIGVGKVIGAYRRWLNMETRPGAQPVAPMPITTIAPRIAPTPPIVIVGRGYLSIDYPGVISDPSRLGLYIIERQQCDAEWDVNNHRWIVPAAPNWGEWAEVKRTKATGWSDPETNYSQAYRYRYQAEDITGNKSEYSNPSDGAVPLQIDEADLGKKLSSKFIKVQVRQAIQRCKVNTGTNLPEFLSPGTGRAVTLDCSVYSTDECTGGTAISGGDYDANYPPTNAYDDNESTLWASERYGSNIIGVDYCGYQHVAAKGIARIGIRQADFLIRVYNPDTRSEIRVSAKPISSVIVQYSENGVDWIDIKTVSLVADTSLQFINIWNGPSSGYWRLLANASPGGWNTWPAIGGDVCHWGVAEIEMSTDIGDSLICALADGFDDVNGQRDWLVSINESIPNAWSNMPPAVGITSLTRSGTTGTCVCSAAHGLPVGAEVTPLDVSTAGWTGPWIITAVPAADTFQFTVPSSLTTPATLGTNPRACPTVFLLIARDAVTGEVSFPYTLLPLNDDPTRPNTPVEDQHWFSPSAYVMERYDGAAWGAVQRLCVGECVVDTAGIVEYTCYAPLARYDSGLFAVSTGQTYTKPHNLGVVPRDIQSHMCQNADGSGWTLTMVENSAMDTTASANLNTGVPVVKLTRKSIILRGQGTSVARFHDETGTYQAITSAYKRVFVRRGY